MTAASISVPPVEIVQASGELSTWRDSSRISNHVCSKHRHPATPQQLLFLFKSKMPRNTLLSAFLIISLLAERVISTAGSPQTALQSVACEDPQYRVHLLSKSPLVIYISDFVTADEREHVQELTLVSYIFDQLWKLANISLAKAHSHAPQSPTNLAQKANAERVRHNRHPFLEMI